MNLGRHVFYYLLIFVVVSFPGYLWSATDICDDGNPCTVDLELLGDCFHMNADEGTSCDDGLFCNGEDVCDGAGTCIHRYAPDCSYLDTGCQTGYCDESQDECVVQYLPDTTECDDGLFCTIGDHCEDGVCVPTGERNCEEEMGVPPDECKVWSCDEDLNECVQVAGADDQQCDDGQFCTVNDHCEAGECVGSQRDCSSVSGPCKEGMCDEESDMCVVGDPKPANTPCDDGQFCTVNERCDGYGNCVSHQQRDCSALATPCADASCDENLDECVLTFHAPGSSCDDGQFCTVNDSCDANGNCVGQARDCSFLDTACTHGECSENLGQCIEVPAEEGTPCEDGRNCTINDHCDGSGRCVAGDVNPCDDGIDCTLDFCNTSADACEHQPQACDDGNPCTINDICDESSGGCTGTPRADGSSCTLPNGASGICLNGNCVQGCNSDDDCNDGIDCTIESCDYSTHTCIVVPENRRCDDRNFCNGEETCQVGVGCVAGEPPSCDDGVDCTQDYCDTRANECKHLPRNSACDDGIYCNGDEWCDERLGCQSSPQPRDCDDGIDCTEDSCDEANHKCVHTPNDALCDDGIFCNGAERCSSVSGCVEGTPVNCDDYIPCTADSCNEEEDKCDHVPDDSLCDDGVFCNGQEVCDELTGCGPGHAPDCDDGIGCTQDSCNVALDECVHVAVDSLCSDGAFCNGMETCDETEGCKPGTPIDCNDGIDCTIDSCNEDEDACQYTPMDVVCDDGKFCTGIEKCNEISGCYQAELPDCSDGIDCTVDLCDNSTDSCVNEPMDSLCPDDGNPCAEPQCSAESGCVSVPANVGATCTMQDGTSGVCFDGSCVSSMPDGDSEYSELEDLEDAEHPEVETDLMDEFGEGWDVTDESAEAEEYVTCRSNHDCPTNDMVCDRDLGICVYPDISEVCEPCISDLNCIDDSDNGNPNAPRCVPWTEDGSGVCGIGCSIIPNDPNCPPLYECKLLPNMAGDWYSQCVPKFPEKSCHPPTDGDFDMPEEEWPEFEYPDLPDTDESVDVIEEESDSAIDVEPEFDDGLDLDDGVDLADEMQDKDFDEKIDSEPDRVDNIDDAVDRVDTFVDSSSDSAFDNGSIIQNPDDGNKTIDSGCASSDFGFYALFILLLLLGFRAIGLGFGLKDE